jgi:hypothetical protein
MSKTSAPRAWAAAMAPGISASWRQLSIPEPVRFELTEQPRQAADYLTAGGKKPGGFLFTGRHSFELIALLLMNICPKRNKIR